MFFIEYTVQVGIVIFYIKCMHIIQEFPTKFQCMKRIWAVFVFSAVWTYSPTCHCPDCHVCKCLTVDRSLSSSFGSRHRLPPPSTDRLQTADISSWYPSTCCHYLKSSMTRCSNGRIQSSIRLPLLQLTLNERSLSFIFSSVYSPLYYDSFSAHCYAQSQSRFETPRTSTLSFVVSCKRACHVRHKILFWYLFALSRGSDQFLKQLWQNTPFSEMFSQASTVIFTKLI